MRSDQYGMPVANFSHSLCENDKRNIAFATKTMEKIWEHAGAQDTLKIDRYAHLVGGARMGFTPDDSVVDSRPPRVGGAQPVRRRRQRVPHRGRRQSGTGDHGPGRPLRRPAQAQAARGSRPRQRERSSVMTALATADADRARIGVRARAYTIPTDQPESDGTLKWDSTTLVLVTAQAGGQTGLGWTYGHARSPR